MRPSQRAAVRAPGGAAVGAESRSACGPQPPGLGRGLVPDPDPRDPAAQVPEEYADGVRPGPGAPARGQLLRGQPDPPDRRGRATSTRSRRTCGCARSTRRRTPGSCSTTCRAPGPGCSAPRRSATPRSAPTARIETRPIKGTTPAATPTRARTPSCARGWRREPKFRGENLMIVDLLRNDLSMVCEAGHGRGAGPDATSSPTRACTSSCRRSAAGCATASRRSRRPARALPGRLDDRRAQAAHDGRSSTRSRRHRAGRTPARSAGSPPTAAPTSAW